MPRHSTGAPIHSLVATESWTRMYEVGTRLFRGCGIDHVLDLGDPIGGEAALLGVFADHFFVGRNIHAVDFVSRNVAVYPLNLGPQFPQDAAGRLRNSLELFGSEFSGSGDLAFDHVFWQVNLLGSAWLANLQRNPFRILDCLGVRRRRSCE